MPEVVYRIRAEGADETARKVHAVGDAIKQEAEWYKEVERQAQAILRTQFQASAAEEARARLGVENKQKEAASLREAQTHTVSLTEKADRLASAFQGVSRDIDSVAGESASKFARFTNDILGTVSALGTGGLAGAASLASIAVSGILVIYNQWQSEVKDTVKMAEEAKKKEAEWLTSTKSLIAETTASLKVKNVEEQRSFAILSDLRVAQLAAEKSAIAMTVGATKAGTAEREQARKDLHNKETELAKAAADRDKAWGDYSVKQNQVLNREILTNARETKEEEKKLALKRQADMDAIMDANSNAGAKEAAEEKTRLEAENADRVRVLDNYRKDMEERAALDKKAAEAAAQLAEKRAKEGQAALDARARLFEAEKKRIEQLREEANAEREAAAASFVHEQAMIAMQPIVGMATSKLAELGEVNRENWRDFTGFADEMPAIAAKLAQSVLAGIAIQAVGKSAFEVAEAAGATAAGFVALATPGGQASAVGYFKGAAEHIGAAGLYAALAGGAAIGAGAIGATRGEGGLFALTKEEKKNQAMKRGGSEGGGGGSRVGGSAGSMNGNASGGGDVYYVYNYESGSVNNADEAQRNRTVQAAQRANARDVFAQRENRRVAA